MKIGEIVRIHVFQFEDGIFSMHTAHQEGGEAVVFRSRMDVWPSVRAGQKGIEYKLLLNSTDEEIARWLVEHPTLTIRKVIEL